jgi:hypothetical protein
VAWAGWARVGRERKRGWGWVGVAGGGGGSEWLGWGWVGVDGLGVGRGGWRWLGTVRREQRAKSEKRESRWREMGRELTCAFWKMVYGKIFRKPFSSIYKAIFRSNFKPFPLTSVLQRPKRPKMLKTFYGKRFTSKQTEPKLQLNEESSGFF